MLLVSPLFYGCIVPGFVAIKKKYHLFQLRQLLYGFLYFR
jgi:hypothetical protein